MRHYDFFGMAVLFVEHFDECLTFYTEAIGMKILRRHSGPGHPDWALLELNGFSLALHAGHDGAPLSPGAVCLNFAVDDAAAAAQRIEAHGGALLGTHEVHDFRPTQPVRAQFGRFTDPDRNEHYLVQVVEELVHGAGRDVRR